MPPKKQLLLPKLQPAGGKEQVVQPKPPAGKAKTTVIAPEEEKQETPKKTGVSEKIKSYSPRCDGGVCRKPAYAILIFGTALICTGIIMLVLSGWFTGEPIVPVIYRTSIEWSSVAAFALGAGMVLYWLLYFVGWLRPER